MNKNIIFLAFVPVEGNRRHGIARWELQSNRCPTGIGFDIGLFAIGKNRSRVAKLQSHERHVSSMASHITKGAGAEIPPATPSKRMITRSIRAHLGRPDEFIPMNMFRAFMGTGWSGGNFRSLWPNRPVGPNMNFFNLTDNACTNDFYCFAETVFSGTLITHLGADLLFNSKFTKNASFFYGVS